MGDDMSFHKIVLLTVVLWQSVFVLTACGPKYPDFVPPTPTGATCQGISHAMMVPPAQFNTERYAYREESGFKDPLQTPLSTFAVDVDTAAYSNVRRILHQNRFPEAGAVRIEEMINYFSYAYPQPAGDAPVAVYRELSGCPWTPGHQLLQIGLQAKAVDMKNAPPSNLVFLIDVSGSMSDVLPLVTRSLKMLAEQLQPDDRVAIVVYAGASGVVLPPTSAAKREIIAEALDNLEAGGATAGSAGIELAYQLAAEHLIKGGNNRIILATDGDFNVGQTSEDALVRLIESKRDQGIYLTVLGFGSGNYSDVVGEALADHGNGNYAYIDNLLEAKKVLVSEIGGTLLTVAKDVKLQVEFNPVRVKGYRLIGYENRLLNAEDFANDKKDAGDMGAGHTVTALYEIIPRDGALQSGGELRYQQQSVSAAASAGGELALVKYRYKHPEEDSSQILSFTVNGSPVDFAAASDNQRFAAAVAAFGMLLRDSQYKGAADWDWITATARGAKGVDAAGDRAEFVKLVELAKMLEQKR